MLVLAAVQGLVPSTSYAPSSALARAARRPDALSPRLARMSIDDDVCVDELCSEPPPPAKNLRTLGSDAYAEESRQYRRTVYMHDEWVKHRSSDRYVKNMLTITSSGVGKNLGKELSVVSSVAVFVIAINMLLGQYQDLSGNFHEGPLHFLDKSVGPIAMPTLPFTIAMPALSLLLVFRTNTGYARWNEARTLWGGVINSCRNVVRQANLVFADDDASEARKERLAANTQAFSKALRNFLRGPSDDPVFRGELDQLVDKELMTAEQVEACMAAKNRPMFQLNAMSANVRAAGLDPIDRQNIDRSITTLVDLTGACERIFKSPVPLVYTRHTSRFLTTFLLFLPFGIWPVMDKSWNHWATVPGTAIIAFFLLGIEEIGMQIEEPFSILPIEAFCDGAIAATIDELVTQKKNKHFDFHLAEKKAAEAFAVEPSHEDGPAQLVAAATAVVPTAAAVEEAAAPDHAMEEEEEEAAPEPVVCGVVARSWAAAAVDWGTKK